MIEAIKGFLWVHPWWHAALIIVPSLVLSAVVGWRENHHAKIANRLNKQLGDSVGRIADNTARVPTEAEKNADKLRSHLGANAQVSEGKSGAMLAQIVKVSDDNLLTLFTPAGYSSSVAFEILVRCDKLQIVELPSGLLQIRILERYGDPIQLGNIQTWENRNTPPTGPRPRGNNVFHSNYRLEGSANRRGIFIYAPTNGNPEYTLAMFADGNETGALYGDRVEISKRFALLQIEWLVAGYVRDGGGTGGSAERLFLFTS
jgi:hypothetical protein